MRRVPGQRLAQAFADQFDVVLRILAEVALDLVADLIGEIDEAAVEVLAALQFVAPQRHVHQYLFQAHRVGHRHQHDLPAQAALAFQLGQALLEVPGHQHAGQFVGVQRGLDVDLAAGPRAEVETVDLSGDAGDRCQQVMGLVVHGKS